MNHHLHQDINLNALGSTVLCDQGSNKPWTRGDKASGGEDTMTKRAEEHMSKIAGDFCNWLRDLPGEDRAINSLSETQLRVSIYRGSYSLSCMNIDVISPGLV